MARGKKGGKGCLVFIIATVTIFGGIGFWASSLVGAMPTGPAQMIVITKPRGTSSLLNEFQEKGIIKSAFTAQVLVVLGGNKRIINPGVYRVNPGMSTQEVLTALRNPIKQLVRIPEEKWISQIAKLLEDKKVAKASDYLDLTSHSEKFSDSGIPFFNDSLEGFLYPDTYNFAPDIGADYIIKRQLMNFVKRTEGLGLTKENMRRTIIIASMIEKEASDYKEKQMIAGVIENRLNRGMRLQIDATINYAIQNWRLLTYKDYSSVKSLYNTYLQKGLPPGPICSPTVKSIEAALHPINHNFVYYISIGKETHFTATYPEHLVFVKLRDTMKAQKK